MGNEQRWRLAAHALHEREQRGHLLAFFFKPVTLYFNARAGVGEFRFDFRQASFRQAQRARRLDATCAHPGSACRERHIIPCKLFFLGLDLFESRFATNVKLACFQGIDLGFGGAFLAAAAFGPDAVLNATLVPVVIVTMADHA